MSVPNIHELAVKRKSDNKRLHLEQQESDKTSGLVSSEREEGQVMGTVVAKYSVTPTRPSPSTEAGYYGINIPHENQDNLNSQRYLHVYTDKVEALNVVKQHKKARFKVFKTRQEAVDFALHSCIESCAVLETIESKFRPGTPTVGEKPSPFKGPKAQELVKLRKSIECGDLLTVQTVIWENPRYLVSSGDTPAILQEGSRYNALHVAAKAKNASMTELILQTVGDLKFICLLYGDENIVNCEDRVHILLDLYLNTPDKGLNETPLHFAVKYGAAKVVDILVSNALCDKQLKNKYGQTPKDIVCSRVNSPDAFLKEEISNLLDDRFYVPVLRSEDNTLQPSVGKPFSPVTCPPKLNDNPLDTRVEIRAYAGPMNQQEAAVFRKKWKTPPRVQRSALAIWRLADSEKGLEREGRNLAQQLKVGWKEYWKFLDTFVDISSSEGLQKLENYLLKKHLPQGLYNVHCEANPIENLQFLKFDDVATFKKSPDHRQEFRAPVGPTSPVSPMTDLCMSLQACSLMNKSTGSEPSTPKCMKKYITNSATDSDRGDSGETISQEEEILMSMLTKPGLSPFLYVEKSCQVFGKRIADGLIHIAGTEMSENGESIFDFLKQEMKHLQSLVNSYMDDPRFVSVDFHLVHSRVASIVRAKLSKLSPPEFDVIVDICSFIEHYKANNHGSSDEEDLNTNVSTFRNQAFFDKKRKTDNNNSRNQVHCIAQFIFMDLKSLVKDFKPQKEIEDKVQYQTEEDCMKIWSDAMKCCCHWQTQSFVRNSRKSSSYNRLKYTASRENSLVKNTTEDIVRCLTFESPSFVNGAQHSERWDSELSMNATFCFNGEEESPEVDSDDEMFYTASSSPEPHLESSEDEMESPNEGESVFIEGHIPSHVDLAVLQALEQCHISPDEHPNIFRWKHSVMLFSPEERAKWASSRPTQGGSNACTSNHKNSSQQFADKTSYLHSMFENWHRVIPPTSPASPQFKREIN